MGVYLIKSNPEPAALHSAYFEIGPYTRCRPYSYAQDSLDSVNAGDGLDNARNKPFEAGAVLSIGYYHEVEVVMNRVALG